MRKKIVAGNWKMNHGYHEAFSLFDALLEHKEDFPSDVEVVICPPSLYLSEFCQRTSAHIQLAAQNCHFAADGAFTGELSATMISSVGAKYCITGHSERRMLFGETDEVIARKVKQILSTPLQVIFCCGEPREMRDDENHFAWVEKQVKTALYELSADEIARVIVAYEPVWAIGTGLTATPGQAQEMHAFIRSVIGEKFGNETAAQIRILYGGSVNAENASSLFQCADVDGGLVGGASLKLSTFLPVIKAAK